MSSVGQVVMVSPIVPACTGNGLAMRAGMFLEALSEVSAVDLVVVPVSGPPDEHDWSSRLARSVQVLNPVSGVEARPHVTAQLGDARLRARLEAAAPLPARAMLAPPTLAADAACARERASIPPAAVLALRGYLAPLGAEIAFRTNASRFVVDLDEDEEPLLRAFGEDGEADAFHRLVRAWLPDADAVLTASPLESDTLREGYQLDNLVTVPNAMRPMAKTRAPKETGSHLLFVGNLTYPPNLEAASILVNDVLPLVRRRRPDATVDLVGSIAPSNVDHLGRPGVTIAGLVPDVTPWYARAAAVVVPLRHGAGTRLKVLEAFAYRRPVVATPVAVAGLAVDDGDEVLISDTPSGLARAVTSILDSSSLGNAIAQRAADTLEARFVPSAVYPTLRHAVLGQNAPSAMPAHPAGTAGVT